MSIRFNQLRIALESIGFKPRLPADIASDDGEEFWDDDQEHHVKMESWPGRYV